MPAVFDAAAPTPHPMGLVGLNRSARRGEGSEFATIRPFQVGDRLKRIHWPMSLRSQTLHVTSTWADEDAEIMLLVDASTDLGRSEGIDGFASSLDVTVRAAGAVAEHFLRHSDRVGLCVFGPSLLRIPPPRGAPTCASCCIGSPTPRSATGTPPPARCSRSGWARTPSW